MDGIVLGPGMVGDAPALACIRHAACAGPMPGPRVVEPALHALGVSTQGDRGLGEPWSEAEVLLARHRLMMASNTVGLPLGHIGLALYAFRRNHAALAFHGRHGIAVTACRDAAANDEAEPDLRLVWPAASPDLTRGANA
jgi:hypothetical protein